MADKLASTKKNTPKEPKSRSAAMGFIFLTIFIDVLGLGIIIPVMPELLKTLGHVDISTASRYNGWLTFVYASMQLVFASIMGNLSDRYGRRPVLLISLVGFSIDYVFGELLESASPKNRASKNPNPLPNPAKSKQGAKHTKDVQPT